MREHDRAAIRAASPEVVRRGFFQKPALKPRR